MADPDIVEIACARAWGVYLMINRGIDENDARQEKLRIFIRKRWEAGDSETELMAVEGLRYLKKLDGSPTGQARAADGRRTEPTIGKNRNN
jgi:hypothetical protein